LPPQTHLAISPTLCGSPLEMGDGVARAELTTLPEMAVDAEGLVHGGFVFGLADYAAMLAVNHPHVVLAKATVTFLKPVVVGERLVADARRQPGEGKRITVRVEVRRGEETVMAAEMGCVVLARHVLTERP
jgi:uncharacterized protein (TIGR00369 family)